MLSWATKETATVPQAHNANAFLGFRSTTLLAEPSAKNSDSLKLLYWQALGTIKEVLHQSPWMWPRWLYSYFPAALCRTISKRALIIYASWREHLPLKNIKKDLFFLLYGVFHCQMSVLKCPRIQHCYKTPRINLHLLSISYLSVSTHSVIFFIIMIFPWLSSYLVFWGCKVSSCSDLGKFQLMNSKHDQNCPKIWQFIGRSSSGSSE